MDHKYEYQVFLDDISECFIARNFAAWRDRVVFPFSMITRAGPVVLTTPEQLEDNFNLYLKACDAMGLDQIVRKPISLELCPDGSWIGTYETNLLRHGQRTIEPYVSSALLHIEDGQFRMSSILNARGHADWTGVMPDLSSWAPGRRRPQASNGNGT